MSMKEVELFRLMQSEHTAQCWMFLREKDGSRTFPIVIGPFEMRAIHDRVHGEQTKRPMTHDLIERILDALEAEVRSVEITKLESEIFYARLNLARRGGDEVVSLDARPSDAVAIATAASAPLYVDDTILDSIGVIEEEDDAVDDDADDDESGEDDTDTEASA